MSSMADPEGLSLEAAHNIVHNAVGGSFASIDVTAFDPLLYVDLPIFPPFPLFPRLILTFSRLASREIVLSSPAVPSEIPNT